MRILLAHPGTQHAFRLARECETRGMLAGFWTGLAFSERSIAARLARGLRGWPAIAGLNSRVATGIDPTHLHTIPVNELRALWHLRRGRDSIAVLHARNEHFQHAIPDSAIANADVVVGFDTSAWILAQRTEMLEHQFVLDRSIAHPGFVSRCLSEFQVRYPRWFAETISRPDYLRTAEDLEHRLARQIVVGSSFAQRTLVEAGIDRAKICINPYGVDWPRFAAQCHRSLAETADRPVRFLFVGSVIGRKGVPVLLDAWKRIAPDNAELHLVGYCGPREQALIPPMPGLRVVGRIPHTDIPIAYAAADVLVLPSYVEGFSLVLLEALASGLPIIATPNAGAEDLVENPILGKIVAAGSVDELESALRHYISARPDRAAVATAAARFAPRYSWTAYGERWAALLQRIC